MTAYVFSPKLQKRWDESEAALRVLFNGFYHLHERKPEKNSPKIPAWELEQKYLQRISIDIHNERIAICTEHLKEMRKMK